MTLTAQQEVQALLDQYLVAYRSGDAAGCAACYLPDGAIYSPYAPPADGRAAIEALHRDWTDGGSDGKSLVLTDFGCAGDLAWGMARYTEGVATGEGTSLSVFERQATGNWLIRVSSLNAAQ